MINFGNKVNTISLSLASLVSDKYNIKAQKINDSLLDTYGMVIVAFFVKIKVGRVQFFEKTFLLTNIRIDIAFRLSFLIISNININFNHQNPNLEIIYY